MAPTESSAATEVRLPAPPATGRGWFDVTVRLATSWVGLFTAYAAAVTLALSNVKALRAGFTELGLPPWIGIALLAALPLLALVISTIPAAVEQRRIKRYGEIKVDVRAGYFTLRPRETEEEFERVDNAHLEVLRWIENTTEPVLYLTGASGTGKSSLLAAWVVPKLMREGHVVIQLRGYEQLFERIKDRVLEPGIIWIQPPIRDTDLRSLLDRAAQRLGARRLILVIDQFEEFLILKDEEQQRAFQQFLSAKAIAGVTFLLVFRPEYEGLIQNQSWPTLKLDTNRKVIVPFTENAATEFLRKSGLTLNTDLMRAVMREAAEIEHGTVGLIRPVTINLCGLVLSRFSSGLPPKFRGGIIRGFLRESLLLTEVRDVAQKIIPNLITGNTTKRPRKIAEMAQATGLTTAAIRACMRRLGESDRAIVRPLDEQQETWEISHDFLVLLLDTIVARRTVSVWRKVRPWLPWVTAAILGVIALVIPRIAKQDPTTELRKQGWIISEKEGLVFARHDAIPLESIFILRSLPPPYSLDLSFGSVVDISALRELRGLTKLDLSNTNVVEISALQELESLTTLDLSYTRVADISALRELKSLTTLDLSNTKVADISALRELKGLKTLYLSNTRVVDISPLQELRSLTTLDLSNTNVANVLMLRELNKLTTLDLSNTNVADVSALSDLNSLTEFRLDNTNVADVSALGKLKRLTTLSVFDTKVVNISTLQELKSLSKLNLSDTQLADISPLRDLKSLITLDFSYTRVANVSALRELKGLKSLNLAQTKVADISALREMKELTDLRLDNTNVTDVEALRELKNLTSLYLSNTQVVDISALQGMKNLKDLHLDNTNVSDAVTLRELKGLRTLDLRNTKVVDLSGLWGVNGLAIQR